MMTLFNRAVHCRVACTKSSEIRDSRNYFSIFNFCMHYSKPPMVERRIFRSKGPGFKTCCCYKTLAVSFTTLCPCLAEDTLLGVYVRGSKNPTQGVNM